MYNNPSAAGAAGIGAATLPYTGIDAVWLLLAGFALIAAGSAMRRMLPVWRRKRDDEQ